MSLQRGRQDPIDQLEKMENLNMEEYRIKLDSDGYLVIEVTRQGFATRLKHLNQCLHQGVMEARELTPYRALYDGIAQGNIKVDRWGPCKTRASYNCAKDWLDQLFPFPGLVLM